MSDEAHGGAEIIQAAALEAIKAFRSFLDIAESVVREPGTAAVVGKAFAEAAASAFRPPSTTGADPPEADEPDEEEQAGGFRRIHLTD